MYDYNNKDKSKEEGIYEWYELFTQIPRDDSDKDNYYPHGRPYKTTPIWDTLSTLFKLRRQRELRKGKITPIPTKGTSKYHR